MKTKWTYSDIVKDFFAILLAIGFNIAVWYLEVKVVGVENRLYGIIMCVAVVLIDIWLLFRFDYFEIMKFDEKGFYFYNMFGFKGFCSWDSIESISLFRTKRGMHIGKRGHHNVPPVYAAIFTSDHYLTPDMDEYGKVFNRDRDGKRFKLNRNKTNLAWAIQVSEYPKPYNREKLFKEYLAYYHPDVSIIEH